jgi:hypothetical protein
VRQEQRKTAGNSECSRSSPLFRQRLNPRRPSISAKNEILLADNFLQKQQKQRETTAPATASAPDACPV